TAACGAVLRGTAVQPGPADPRRAGSRRHSGMAARPPRRLSEPGAFDAGLDGSGILLRGISGPGDTALSRYHGLAEPFGPRRTESGRIRPGAWSDHRRHRTRIADFGTIR